jgi:hypothetical protein
MITIDQAAPAAVTDGALADLAERLRRTRAVANPWRDQPDRGVPSDQLNDLLRYWAAEYDWRGHEERIRALPWAGHGAGAGSLRFIHQRSDNPAATAVVLLHGWPDSVLRFERVLPLLTDFHVVVPALPGFPFAPAMEEALSAEGIADLVATAMAGLGYDRYVVSGADSERPSVRSWRPSTPAGSPPCTWRTSPRATRPAGRTACPRRGASTSRT